MAPVDQAIADEIKHRYVEGTDEWRLPSERQLAKDLGVDRRTLRKGLTTLIAQGVIVQPAGGRIRRIVRSGRAWPGESEAIRPSVRVTPKAPVPSQGTTSSQTVGDPMEMVWHAGTPAITTKLRLSVNDLCAGAAESTVKRWHAWADRFSREHRGTECEFSPYNPPDVTPPKDHESFDLLECLAANAPNFASWTVPTDSGAMIDPRLDSARFDPVCWSEVTGKDRLTAVPFGSSVECLVVLTENWERFGTGQPVTSWTWHEFLDVADRFVRATGNRALIALNAETLLRTLGFDVLAGQGCEMTAEAEALVRRVADLGAVVSGTDAMVERVVDGQVLARVSLSSVVPRLAEIYPNKMTVLPMPCEPTGFVRRNTQALYTAANSSHPVDVGDLIAFLCDDSVQRELALSGHLIPATLQARESFGLGPLAVRGVRELLATFDRARPLPLVVQACSLIEHRAIRREWQDYVAGRRPLAAALDRMRRRANGALNAQSTPVS